MALRALTAIVYSGRLAAYSSSRRQLVDVLGSLTETQWALSGQHEARGAMTIPDLLQALGDHEIEHIDQIGKVLTALEG